MSVVARFAVPAEQFPLGEVLEATEHPQVRLETMIPTGDSVIPYFWVSNQDAEAIEQALRQSSLVESVRSVDRINGETLFRVSWSAEVDGLIDAIRESEGVILHGEGLGDEWVFRIRFREHADVSAFYRTCLDEEIGVNLTELNHGSGDATDPDFGLTDSQREALLAALDSGYFSVPRTITLKELAGQLDISDTALSQRIRRGLNTLLSSTLRQRLSGHHVDRDVDDESQ